MVMVLKVGDLSTNLHAPAGLYKGIKLDSYPGISPGMGGGNTRFGATLNIVRQFSVF